MKVDDFWVHVPANAPVPLTVLVSLHGMGGNGQDQIESVRSLADSRGWGIVAPTFGYGDWRDPAQLCVEDPANATRIAKFLDRLPDVVGRSVKRQVLVYGFSRGGQTANRFALAYPERVAGAALASSGTYTLPLASMGEGDTATRLVFPYGVADFPDLFGKPFDSQQFTTIPFWIGVGANDVNPAEVPHQWDPYIGAQRVQRAEEFTSWLQRSGMRVQLDVFTSGGHGETAETRAAALGFLSGLNRS